MAGMTSRERIEAAIALKKPDRVPVAPMIDFFAAKYGGITQHDMFFDIRKADSAFEKTFADLGRVDAIHQSSAGLGRIFDICFPIPPHLPGIRGVDSDSQFQFDEKMIMTHEEYHQIKRKGEMRWILSKVMANHPELSDRKYMARLMYLATIDLLKIRVSIAKWRRRGIEIMVGPNIIFPPFDGFSMGFRSFTPFITDIFRYPEEVKAGTDALLGPLELTGYIQSLASGVKRVFIGIGRASATYISPAQFEKFALGDIENMCMFYIRKGITPVLHLDNDWTEFFPYFKCLPRGKCILNLDGSSDIFEAKEVLGDYMCIMGDVPAPLLELGDPEEVDQYCRKLIEIVGEDGGFILSSGCSMPMDSKPENVKAMISSVEKYGYYK